MFIPSIETVCAVIALIIGYWVHKNARARGASDANALVWAIVVVMLPPIFLPLYFIFRPKMKA